MKKILCAALAAVLLITLLPGCGQKMKEPVTFYYQVTDYQGTMVCPIAGEEREVAGYRDNLKYLLTFYLMGPISQELASPLPQGTQLQSINQSSEELTIEISDTASTLSDSAFSLACACLSTTCMGLTNAEAVTVVSGSRSLTLDKDNLLLSDTITPEENTK